mmetsp:Transcript_24535/g.39518  ORF Transcript_24535/g.39518 Transcript_24535/m.39518 type:complete len:250 (+) Transcript_24535:371-1120(+)
MSSEGPSTKMITRRVDRISKDKSIKAPNVFTSANSWMSSESSFTDNTSGSVGTPYSNTAPAPAHCRVSAIPPALALAHRLKLAVSYIPDPKTDKSLEPLVKGIKWIFLTLNSSARSERTGRLRVVSASTVGGGIMFAACAETIWGWRLRAAVATGPLPSTWICKSRTSEANVLLSRRTMRVAFRLSSVVKSFATTKFSPFLTQRTAYVAPSAAMNCSCACHRVFRALSISRSFCLCRSLCSKYMSSFDR